MSLRTYKATGLCVGRRLSGRSIDRPKSALHGEVGLSGFSGRYCFIKSIRIEMKRRSETGEWLNEAGKYAQILAA